MNDNDKTYRISALLAGAMIMGQLLFAGISWYLNSTGARTPQPSTPLFLYVWLAIALGGIMGALMFRGRLANVDLHTPVNLQAAQNNVVIMWALLEAGGLFALVIYFLEGNPNMLYAALGYIVASAIFFFPRREWFGRQI